MGTRATPARYYAPVNVRRMFPTNRRRCRRVEKSKKAELRIKKAAALQQSKCGHILPS